MMTVDMLREERVERGLAQQPKRVTDAWYKHMTGADVETRHRAYGLLQRWAATGSHYDLAPALISAAVHGLGDRSAGRIRNLVADLSPPAGTYSPRLGALVAAVRSPSRPASGWPAKSEGRPVVATACPEGPTLIVGDVDDERRREVLLAGWNDQGSVVLADREHGRLRLLGPGEVIHEVRTA